MPTEIENIEESEVKFDRDDKIFLLVVGLIILILVFIVLKVLF